MITDPRHYYTGIALEHMLRNDALASASREEIADAAVKMADAVLSRLEMDVAVETVAAPEPDADGWIEWTGGECPVEFGSLVDVKYRDGTILNEVPALIDVSYMLEDASASFWIHDGLAKDIIAYRIHKP